MPIDQSRVDRIARTLKRLGFQLGRTGRSFRIFDSGERLMPLPTMKEEELRLHAEHMMQAQDLSGYTYEEVARILPSPITSPICASRKSRIEVGCSGWGAIQ